MIDADDNLDGTWPYAPRFSNAPGFRMHYVDEGPRAAGVVLCLHGEPTWGYLFRHLIGALRDTHRVVVPDHAGFGKSATPGDRTFWLQDHTDNLERLVLDLDLTAITLVMHDFGGPTGMGLAARHPDRIARIISVNGPTPFGQPDLLDRISANVGVSPWFQWILKAEKEGVLEQVLGQLGYNALSTLKLNGFEDHAIITPTWLRAYGGRYRTPDDCLGVIGWAKGYATGAHQFPTPSPAAYRNIAEKPAMAMWGEADRTLHAEHFLPLFAAIWPDAPVHRVAGAGHYSPEDAPAMVSALIRNFLALT